MSIAKVIINHLIRLVVDVDGINTEIERQAQAWLGDSPERVNE